MPNSVWYAQLHDILRIIDDIMSGADGTETTPDDT